MIKLTLYLATLALCSSKSPKHSSESCWIEAYATVLYVQEKVLDDTLNTHSQNTLQSNLGYNQCFCTQSPSDEASFLCKQQFETKQVSCETQHLKGPD